MRNNISNLGSLRTLVISFTTLASSIYGHPLTVLSKEKEEAPIDYGSADFIEKMVVIMALVLLGGAFAGNKRFFDFFLGTT